MEDIFGEDTAMFRKASLVKQFVTLFVLLLAPFSFASQSSIDQRGGFNSSRQLSLITNGSWGMNDKSFASGSFIYQRTPTSSAIGTPDTFYQGSLGVGYAIDNLAFDLNLTYGQTPLQQIESIGGSLGLTYIFIPGGANAGDFKEHALEALHAQIYTKEEGHSPLFWLRLGYTGNSMHSALVPAPNDKGKETALSIDLYYPFGDDFLFSLSAGFHGYDDSTHFFNHAFQGTVTSEQQLFQSTLQGLPHSNVAFSTTWQLAPRDSLLPRYQATELDSTRLWAHSLDLGWRHQFTRNWFMNPTYEMSIYQSLASSAVILEVFYIF